MKPITQEKIVTYVEQHIPEFHKNRIEKLKKLKLQDVLKRKNPYLFKVKNIAATGAILWEKVIQFNSGKE